MSMNVIIIAAIGLLILLILAFLVVNYIGRTNEGLKSCAVAYGGVCDDTCSGEPATSESTDCSERDDGNTNCCKVIG